MADDPDTVTATALDSVGAEPFVFVFAQASTPAAAHNQRLVGSIISPAVMTLEDANFAGEYLAGKADFLP
ncbi:MAG: hypothetical protein M3019_00370, partial [Candidatus Dormibacteraeota bacterium]|nr:hypothetical protein [Candidatus Dormibacteraeota bacterium]